MVVFEVEMVLPKFATFLNVTSINPEKEPVSYIEFNLGLRPTNVCLNFLCHLLVVEKILLIKIQIKNLFC